MQVTGFSWSYQVYGVRCGCCTLLLALSLLTAVLLKGILEIVVVAKNRVKGKVPCRLHTDRQSGSRSHALAGSVREQVPGLGGCPPRLRPPRQPRRLLLGDSADSGPAAVPRSRPPSAAKAFTDSATAGERLMRSRPLGEKQTLRPCGDAVPAWCLTTWCTITIDDLGSTSSCWSWSYWQIEPVGSCGLATW
jgi:hypothetical protein